MKISDFAIKHPKVIIMLLVILLVFGLMSAFNLRRSLIADMSMPTIVVITTWPGVGPSDIEVEITNPLEEALSTLSGLNLMTSTSRNSVSVIELQLGYNEKAEDRLYEIREKINSAMGDLPEGLPAPPRILQYSTAELPIMTIIVSGEGSRSELSTLCRDHVVPALSRISGVGNVNMNGDSREIVEILIDLDRLSALQISLLDIAKIMPVANFSLPGGDGIYQGYNLNIRTDGRFTSLKDFEDQVLAFKDGQFIRLKDTAQIEFTEDRRTNYIVSGGEDSLSLSIIKQPDGDSVAISREIRSILNNMEKEYAGALSFNFIKDDAENISMSVNSVLRSALMGALLAVFILFLFLHNTSTTLMISFAIPLSILFTMLALWVKGSSLDLVTLGGITAAIGMVIDASIVVLEMIQRHFDKGKLTASESASLGVNETGSALVASMTTTLAAFFPVLFLTGLAGIILKDVAWTMIFSIFFSMLVAIVVIPFLCALFLKKNDTEKLNKINLKGFGIKLSDNVEKFMNFLNRSYKKLLLAAIKNKFSFITGTLVLFIMSIFSLRLLGFEFLAQTDMAEIVVTAETPGGYTLEMTRDKVLHLERTIKELIGEELDTSYFIVGQGGAFSMGSDPNRAYGTIKLKRLSYRKRHVVEIVNELQDKIKRMIPDLQAEFRNGGLSNLLSLATGGEGLVVNVYGANLDTVIAASAQVRQYMQQDPNVANTDVNIRFNQREMNARLLHQYLGRLGLSSYEAALTNRIVFNGISLGTFYGKDKNYPIELRTNLGRSSIPNDVLYSLGIKTSAGTQVSYATFSELGIEETLSQINHRDKSRSITVSASLKDPNVRESTRRLENLLNTQGIVPGAGWELGGTAAEMLSSFKSLIIVLAAALFLVYSVMVIQFERFTQPLLVMSSIPFTLIGITGGLLIFRSSLNIVSIMGIITLAGLVVNNAIILISYINLLRDKYALPLEEAVITGAISRLKPILMTTVTTLFGVIPLSMATGEGSEVYAPLGQSIFGGLFSSTFITLFFIPVVYLLLEKRRESKINKEQRIITQE
ncbi:MAG: efflux RND transporter permease subunit [Treponema sp.]|nr:efflux RND transporter permease subunit [Treponema sp.]MCL2251392.1 efflux RND transporter permease subunit [Treponema sp.]